MPFFNLVCQRVKNVVSFVEIKREWTAPLGNVDDGPLILMDLCFKTGSDTIDHFLPSELNPQIGRLLFPEISFWCPIWP
jgi:hypothetical protein